MARRNMSGRKHAKKFGRARRTTKAINQPKRVSRGGIQL